ncbi:hypothetical protein F5Y16DRAFT_409212 [Xylariaceae sp. FL0255]|nr:hypothetical protein F5Y16DRAFT_409212 [Xylariaceae sp. FL0255]
MATNTTNTMLKPLNKQQQSLLLSMVPVEMILTITDQTTASAADAVSLALTCKALFLILSERSIKRLDTNSKQMLLINLERDISWVVYCPVARTLLPFSSKGNNFPLASTRELYFTEPAISYSIYEGADRNINFLTTRLVRNHRLYGPTHGIPLRNLTLTGIHFSSSIFMQIPCRVFLETSRRAKWIDQDLIVSSTWIVHVVGIELVGRVISPESLRRFLLDMHISDACRHCTFEGGLNYSYGALNSSFNQAGARLSQNMAYEDLGSCCICETDWDVSISWAKRGLVFKLTRYHDLGCCSIPPDPKWLCLVERDWTKAMRSPRETCYGCVRSKWIDM